MEIKRKNIFIQAWELMVTTTVAWDDIASKNATRKSIRSQYSFPWILICVFSVLFFKSLYANEKPIETGFLNAIITAVSYFGGYFLSNAICYWYLRKQIPDKYSELDCEKIVSYSLTTIFIIKTITTALPSLFFLQILYVYTAYLVWEGCRAVLKLEDEERGNIVIIFSLLIIFSPALISFVIRLMLPNA